jgi:cell wall-associated NlpC family hydrolase
MKQDPGISEAQMTVQATKSSTTTTATASAVAQPLLKQGSTGPVVKELQQKLKAAGFNPGPIDGDFGPKTFAAVKSFQKAKGLTTDGIVGPKTWAALNGAKPVTPTTPPAVSGVRQKIISIAEGELGLKEVGNNRGDILKYPRYFGRGAEAWCADFASWVYTHAGVPMNNASCASVVSHLKATGKWKTSNPQPGDLVLFDWRGADGRSDHVGIVVSVNKDGSVNTIEGNAKNSSGVQGVFRHTRKSGILGYGSLY